MTDSRENLSSENVEEVKRFIDREMKLQNIDQLFLFLTSILGFFFSFIYVFIGSVEVAIGFMPIIVLGLVVPIYIGYVRGAIILDSLEERVRGWIYLVAGVTVYISGVIISLVNLVPLPFTTPVSRFMKIAVLLAGTFILGFSAGRGKLTDWLSIRILKTFGKEVTMIGQHILDKTNGSAFYAGFYLFIAFSVFLVAQDVVFRIVGLLLFFSIALWHLFTEERATRKLIKLNRYSEFLETQRQRVKKPIPFKVGFPLGCALLMGACILYVFDLTVEPLFAVMWGALSMGSGFSFILSSVEHEIRAAIKQEIKPTLSNEVKNELSKLLTTLSPKKKEKREGEKKLNS